MKGILLLTTLIFLCAFFLGHVIFTIFKLDSMGLKYRFPLGYLCLIGLLQIAYYPIQHNQLSSSTLHKVTLSGLAISFVFGFSFLLYQIYKNKNSIKTSIKECNLNIRFDYVFQIVLSLIVLVIGVYFLMHYQANYFIDDNFFYYDFIYKNINTDSINDVIMRTVDTNTVLAPDQAYNGLYHFYSSIVWLFQNLAEKAIIYPIHYIGIFSWIGSLLLYLSLPLVICDSYNYVSKKYNLKIVYILVPLIILIAFQYWYVIYAWYGNSLMKLTIAYMLIFMNEMIAKDKSKYGFIVMILMFSFSAQTSTSLFTNAFILYTYAIVAILKNKKNVFFEIFLMYIPTAIFGYLFIDSMIIMGGFSHLSNIELLELIKPLIVYVGVGLVVLAILRLERFISIFYKIVVVLLTVSIPIVFYKFGQNIEPYSPGFINDLNHIMSVKYLIINFNANFLESVYLSISWIGIIVLLIYTFHEKDFQGISWMIIIFIISFFNPYVYNFIATYMTNLIFHRMFDVIFNPFTITLIFMMYTKIISKTQIRNYLLFSSMFLILFWFASDNIRDNQIFKTYTSNSNLDYYIHTSKLDYGVIEKLQNEYLVYETEKSLIISHIPIVNQLYQGFNGQDILAGRGRRIEGYKEIENETHQYLYSSFPLYYHNKDVAKDYSNVCSMNIQYNVKYIIVESQYNGDYESALGFCAQKMFEVDTYRVFMMQPSWYEEYLKNNEANEAN